MVEDGPFPRVLEAVDTSAVVWIRPKKSQHLAAPVGDGKYYLAYIRPMVASPLLLSLRNLLPHAFFSLLCLSLLQLCQRSRASSTSVYRLDGFL